MRQITRTLLIKGLGTYLNLLSHVCPEKGHPLAYAFFSQPRKGRLTKEKLPLLLQQAQHETHACKQQQFQTYTWKGNEEVILLVHGWESNTNRWAALLKQLLPTRKTIIALDGPAHGLSDGVEFNVPLYAEFIHVVCQKFRPNAIIGHSIGATAAAYYQFKYPGHPLQKLVLLGAPCDFSVIVQNYVNILSLNAKIHEYIRAYTKARFKIAVEDFSASVFLKDCTIPGLIAHDKDDDAVLFTEGEKLAAAWKTAQFIPTNKLGHSMHDAQLYEKVIAFLD